MVTYRMPAKKHRPWSILTAVTPGTPRAKAALMFPVLMALLLSSPPVCADEKFPFSNHEQLEYQVKWNPPVWMFFLPEINAGKLIFNVVERSVQGGNLIHHFKGSAISTSSLVKVNDVFESTSEGDNFCALRMLKQTHEGKRHREVDVTVDRGTQSALLVEKDLATDPPKTIKTETLKDFPPCATDLLAGLYRARMLPLKIGETYQFPLTDNGRIKEVSLKPLTREYVNNEAGFFATQKVEVLSFFGGLFKQKGSFYIWFTDDARHLPVKFEMKVKLGKVYGNLINVKE